MTKAIGIAMIFTAIAGQLFAGVTSPEIDASSAVAAVTLLSGGLLVLRTRRRKQ